MRERERASERVRAGGGSEVSVDARLFIDGAVVAAAVVVAGGGCGC